MRTKGIQTRLNIAFTELHVKSLEFLVNAIKYLVMKKIIPPELTLIVRLGLSTYTINDIHKMRLNS